MLTCSHCPFYLLCHCGLALVALAISVECPGVLISVFAEKKKKKDLTIHYLLFSRSCESEIASKGDMSNVLKYWRLCSVLGSTGLVGSYVYASPNLVGFENNNIKNDNNDSDRDHKEIEEPDDDSHSLLNLQRFTKEFSWFKKQKPIEKPVIINEIQPKDHYDAPKYPIVLCHGLSGFDKLVLIPSFSLLSDLIKGKKIEHHIVAKDNGGFSIEYWTGIKDALEEKGSTVIVAKVPGFGSIEERSSVLNKFISKYTGSLREESKSEIYNDNNETESTFKENHQKVKVNLVAHSMGGLDCRYLISKIENKNFEVVSLTTITTPHRGSEMADYLVDLSKHLSYDIKLPSSIYQLTTSYMKEFNKQVKDDPKVKYFSYGAEFKPNWYNVFFTSWSIINKIAGPNDGMVSVKSAKWGQYLGTLVDVDHLDLINWSYSIRKLTGTVTGNKPNIDTVALYLDIADNLAKQGL